MLIAAGTGTAAAPEPSEPHIYYTLVPGRFAIVGQRPDGGASYAGSAEITVVRSRFRLVRRIGGKAPVEATGTVERADPGEMDVVRFRWPGHQETCLVHSDLDNEARLTCYWTADGSSPKKPGLDAYFSTAAWP